MPDRCCVSVRDHSRQKRIVETIAVVEQKSHKYISLVLVCLLMPFVFTLVNVQAQGPDKRQYVEGKELKKVQNFLGLFLGSLQNVKDIRLIPRNYFVPPFGARVLSYDWARIAGLEPTARLTPKQRLDQAVVMFNFMYLTMLYSSTAATKEGDLSKEDMYPPRVIKMLEKVPLLAGFIDPDSDVKNKNLKWENKTYEEIRRVNVTFRNYLNRHSSEWKRSYKRAVEAVGKAEDGQPFKYMCKDDECSGLPPNMPVISATAFPYDLVLVNIKGRMKILKMTYISR